MDSQNINLIAQSYLDKIEQACKRIKPKVVIQCITYNHKSYLKDALEGFIMQKTDFPFVAIVHEDASTDGTDIILSEYAEKYPDIILPIFEKENQYSQSDKPLDRIIKKAIKATNAKYVALCEGDDYWIDPSKLQKQVDFLDKHPDFSMCFHSVYVINDGGQYDTTCFSHLKQKEYKGSEIIKKWTVPTCSAMYRSFISDIIPFNINFQYGDNVLWLTCAVHGKLYCINEKLAVYRRNVYGWTSQGSYNCNMKQIKHHQGLIEEFGEEFGKDIKDKLLYWYAITFISGVRNLNISTLKYLFNGIKNYGFKFISKTGILIYNYFFKR